MSKLIRIGTRESQLAVWQATQVKEQLISNGLEAELVFIKSEGDTDTKTPLYEMGVQGIFTRSLAIAPFGGYCLLLCVPHTPAYIILREVF